jgi:hypothetical protein
VITGVVLIVIITGVVAAVCSAVFGHNWVYPS